MCSTLAALNSTYSGSTECLTKKLWLSPATTNTPASYVCTDFTTTICSTKFMYYDNILNYKVYQCLTASEVTAACPANYVVYQWNTGTTDGIIYYCLL
jgi:hypothetical protein